MVLRTASDYQQQLRALLPPGPAWEPERVPALDTLLAGLAVELARLDGRATDLLNEMDPATVRELVPDWETVMGLPDACLGDLPSFEDRRQQVCQRLLEVGRQTPAYFVAIAVGQGYPNARVREHRAPRFGRSRMGREHFGTWAVQFIWHLDTGGRKRIGRRFGASYFGERFGVNPGTALVCLIHRYAPAHTVPIINFN